MKRNLKKTTAIVLALLLLFSIFAPAMKVIAAAPINTGEYTQIAFGGDVTTIAEVSAASTVTINYEHGTVTVTGTNLYSEKSTGLNGNGQMEDKYFVYAIGDVTIVANPEEGYTADFREDGKLLGSATRTYTGLEAGGSSKRLDAEFSNANDPNPGGGENNNGPVPIEGGTKVTGNFTYTNSGNGDPADIWLNKTEIGVGEPPADSKEYYYVESTGTVIFDFGVFINNRISSIKINNVDYSSQLPTTKEGWLEVNQGQVDFVSITVPYATTYNIETTTTRDFEWSVGNFLWSYMDKDKGTDDYIGNGTLEFVSLQYKGNTYNSLEALKALNKPYLDFGDSEEEGGAVLPAGAKLTVKLVPNAGYQLTSFTCNGQTFETQEQIGYYTFDVPAGNFHWGANFSAVDDVVKTNSEKVEAGTITLGGAETSMAIGTARLDVTDTTVTNSQVENFESAAGDYTISNYLDISLYNTIYKGTSTESWDTEVTNLDNQATITLKLDDSVNGEDAIIVHEKHDGTYEIIKIENYDSATNTVTFKTKSFSNYAIATKVASTNTVENTEENTTKADITSSNPTTGDNIILFSIIFAIATLGVFATIKLNKNHKVRKH